MAETIDQLMTNGDDEGNYLPLIEEEERVLALYDRLQELRLEIAIINAQQAHQTGLRLLEKRVNVETNDKTEKSAAHTEEETRKAQSDLLEARAKYVLRNNVVEAVMIANPILKAVHNGTDASPIERYVEH